MGKDQEGNKHVLFMVVIREDQLAILRNGALWDDGSIEDRLQEIICDGIDRHVAERS
ncbi:hypothetical protein LCGC14_2672350 [marine sediment metagenome]|uniref:Uncharacterized protein n=1 Tax=marine sediment metagenome TaxID=412755 RepID=A0A0F8ZNP9_9ZZZZ